MLKFVCLVLIVVDAGAIQPSVDTLESEDRIIGGHQATPGQFPYQVSLRLRRHYCGGAIIAPRFILTTVWCTRVFNPDLKITVYVGAHTSHDGTLHELDQITRHPRFRGYDRANDIAVLRTVKPITFNNLVQPIALPTAAIENDRALIFSGWGETEVSDLSRSSEP